MLDKLLSLLQDQSNQQVIGWIGGGVAVVVGGIWAIFKFLVTDKAAKKSRESSNKASHGSIVAGRDVNLNTNRQAKKRR